MTEPQILESQSNESSAAADEVLETLSDSEALLVTEQRKPLNRSTLVTFMVLLLGAAGVWIMYQRTGPKSAAAAVNSKETAAAKQTINSFLSGGEASIRVMETMLRNTQKVVDQFLNYPSMTQVPLGELRTNPFRMRPVTPATAHDDPLADKRRREEQRLAVLKAVEGLRLQSIMHSEVRKGCMINGRLYVEGQQVESLTIEQINPASVIVRSGPYRFELKMQR